MISSTVGSPQFKGLFNRKSPEEKELLRRVEEKQQQRLKEAGIVLSKEDKKKYRYATQQAAKAAGLRSAKVSSIPALAGLATIPFLGPAGLLIAGGGILATNLGDWVSDGSCNRCAPDVFTKVRQTVLAHYDQDLAVARQEIEEKAKTDQTRIENEYEDDFVISEDTPSAQHNALDGEVGYRQE